MPKWKPKGPSDGTSREHARILAELDAQENPPVPEPEPPPVDTWRYESEPLYRRFVDKWGYAPE